MEQAEKKKNPWVKILLTAAAAYVLFYVEMIFIMLWAMTGGAARVGFGIMSVVPLLVFPLIWLPKKKKFMLSLGCVFGAFTVAVIASFFIHFYNQSLIIDTSPAIDVTEYLPFDENSKIVKMRSETVNFGKDAPIIDGAAALVPVYSGFVNATYPENTTLGDGVFQYNNTPNGYKALAERMTDVFIGVYPSQEQLDYAAEKGTHFTFTPIGYDAFVFFVNKDNPIESLTSEQITAIYSGEITNWKELGGKNEEIVAYQRNEGSGSQSMLIRFMKKAPMSAPTQNVVGGMGGIIEEVADYRSVTASIGFSFRFYVEGIIKNPDIKMIAVDGVKPTVENIRSGKYPICTPFYAVTYEENTNPNVAILIDWILSDEGQYIIEQTGYVGVGGTKH